MPIEVERACEGSANVHVFVRNGIAYLTPILRGEQPDASNTPITSPPEPPSPTSSLTTLSSASPPESPPALLPSQLPPLRRSTRTRQQARANAQRRYHRPNACFEVPARESRCKPKVLPPDGEHERDTTLQGCPNKGDCKSSWPSREMKLSCPLRRDQAPGILEGSRQGSKNSS